MREFSAVLAAHAARYPRMEARDYAKLAYQSQFGPAHLLSDPATVPSALASEWAAAEGTAAGPENIGNGLCRFPLSPGPDLTLAAPLLARLVLRTAREHRGTMAGLEAEPRFYFVHSYHAVLDDPADALMTCDYGYPFPAAVRRGNVWGTQFHPEKSHRFGMCLIGNFVKEA